MLIGIFCAQIQGQDMKTGHLKLKDIPIRWA